MALKTLSSTFLSPLPHHFSTSAPRLLKIYTKRTLILCKSVPPQSKTPVPETSSAPITDSAGTGAAAPTPGEVFLENQKAFEAATALLKEQKKLRKKRKKEKLLRANVAVACCYGCGAPLQTSESDAPGYVEPETYELKKKHRQLKTVLCGRCKLLSHGHMITAVGGNGGYSGGKQFVTADQLREKLTHLRYEKVLIVNLVDIVDFNGSFLTRVRDIVGPNPIILVLTKVDLLPKETDFNCIGDWVVEAITKKRLNVVSVHLTSSKSLVGVTGVVSEIRNQKKGRDVYILGAANVGKSAFINALLKSMGEKDPIAASALKYKPIQSAVPGTTLGPIQIEAFLGGGKIYDTPGIHLHHRQAAVVDSEDLPALAPRSRLKARSFPPLANAYDDAADKFKSNGLNGFSIFWGGLVRIDVLKVLPETSLTFFGPKALQIHIVPTDEADEFYQRELGVLLTPPTGKQKAADWTGLEIERQLQIKFEDAGRPACDIAISGLGWIAVEPVRKSRSDSPSDLDETAKKLHLNKTAKTLHLAVHVPKPVEIFVRPPLPVGKVGAEWYQYRELKEEEEEVRPKWYF